MHAAFLTLAQRAPYDRVAVVCKADRKPYRLVQRGVPWLAAGLVASGCASAAGARAGAATPSSASTEDAAIARLVRGSEDQERRILELESRLALLEQDARE